MKKSFNYIALSILFCFCVAQSELKGTIIPLNTGSRYVTTEDGILQMYVNVWGHVNNPGRILVNEGIDLAILLSLTGGPKKGANLKIIRVYREYPDNNGLIVHTIDFTDFIQTGDRTNFVSIQPNDTFIIKQTTWSFFIGEIGTLNTVMNFINLYLNLANLFKN